MCIRDRPYRRRYVVFQQKEETPFSAQLNNSLSGTAGSGVRVTEIAEDPSEFKLDYNPTHPDADEFGYVRMPNVELAREMVDMMSATRSYEANITVMNSTKSMATVSYTHLDVYKRQRVRCIASCCITSRETGLKCPITRRNSAYRCM